MKFKEEVPMKPRLGSLIFCSILVHFCATVGLCETKQFIVFFDFPLAGVTDTRLRPFVPPALSSAAISPLTGTNTASF